MGYGPGCGWLKVDTVEEEVAAGFRQAVATQQKIFFFFIPYSSMCSPSAAVGASEMITEGEAGMFRTLWFGLPTLKVPIKFPTVRAVR